MNILLVFPRTKYVGDIPLGVSYIAAAARKRIPKAEVRILDFTFNNFPNLEKELAWAGVVGIYIETLSFKTAIMVAKKAKKLGKFVLAGGPHSTILPHTVIPHVDTVIQGEGEYEFIDAVTGQITGIREGEPISNLNELPFPALDLLDFEEYAKHWHLLDSIDPKLRGINIMSARGCPFNCSYCQPTLKKMFGTTVRQRSVPNVIHELQQRIDEFGINAFFFHDDTMTFDKKWVFDFCNALEHAQLNLLWGCNSRVDTISLEMLEHMYRVGCRVIHFGAESGSQRILDEIYHKRIKKDQVVKAFEMCDEVGIEGMAFFMMGAPGETKEELNETIKFARSLKAREATFSITTPLPCTTLHEIMSKDYDISEDPDDFDYYGDTRPFEGEIPHSTLKWYQKKAVLYFYLHPYRFPYIWKHISTYAGWKKMIDKVRRYI